MISRARSIGFTLVEMLVAIALLGLLGVISWRGLDYVSGQRERIDRETEETGRMLRVLSQIERDFAQSVPESVLPAAASTNTPPVLPLSINVTFANPDSAAIEILRTAGPDTEATRIQRVIYRIADGVLVRETSLAGAHWPVGNIAHVLPLLPGAQRLGVRAYAGGIWTELARGSAQSSARASGIEITIDDTVGKRYVRVFPL